MNDTYVLCKRLECKRFSLIPMELAQVGGLGDHGWRVLIALSGLAEAAGGNVFPSYGVLAKATGIDRRLMWRALQKLIDNGVIARIPATSPEMSGDISRDVGVTSEEMSGDISRDVGDISRDVENPKVTSPEMPPDISMGATAQPIAPKITKPATKKGTRLPDDWWPSEEESSFAEECGLDPEEVAAQFLDYWIARSDVGACKRDWPATWRNWCRRSQVWQKKPTHGAMNGHGKRLSPLEKLYLGFAQAARGDRGIDSEADGPLLDG